MPKEKKITFHDNVERSSSKSKVTYLVEQSESLIKICKHEEYLKNFFIEYKFLAIFANFDKLWKDIAFLLTIVLNIITLFSFNSVNYFYMMKQSFGDRLYDYRFFLN